MKGEKYHVISVMYCCDIENKEKLQHKDFHIKNPTTLASFDVFIFFLLERITTFVIKIPNGGTRDIPLKMQLFNNNSTWHLH